MQIESKWEKGETAESILGQKSGPVVCDDPFEWQSSTSDKSVGKLSKMHGYASDLYINEWSWKSWSVAKICYNGQNKYYTTWIHTSFLPVNTSINTYQINKLQSWLTASIVNKN